MSCALLACAGTCGRSGHFQLQGIRFAWKPFYGGLAALLERTPITGERKGTIWEHMKNMENNAHMHTQQFIFVTAVATIKFIVKHVVSPPPSLFLRNPARRHRPAPHVPTSASK